MIIIDVDYTIKKINAVFSPVSGIFNCCYVNKTLRSLTLVITMVDLPLIHDKTELNIIQDFLESLNYILTESERRFFHRIEIKRFNDEEEPIAIYLHKKDGVYNCLKNIDFTTPKFVATFTLPTNPNIRYHKP